MTKYEARVLALANAHRLITEGGWKSTSLNELLNILLAPFLDRIAFKGPNVFLEPDPTFGLSMAVHELVTNAGKHGSLTAPSGGVDLTWSVTRTQQGLTLMLEWKETRGPPPGAAAVGIRFSVGQHGDRAPAQWSGRAEFEPEGLQAPLIVPLTHESWPGGLVRSMPELPSRTTFRQVALVPDALITLPHFSISPAMSFSKLAGEPGNAAPPVSARRALIVGSAKATAVALFSVSMTSAEDLWERRCRSPRSPRSRH